MRRADGFSLEMNRISLGGCRIGAALKPILETLRRSEFYVTEVQYIFLVDLLAPLPGRPNKFLAIKEMRNGRTITDSALSLYLATNLKIKAITR